MIASLLFFTTCLGRLSKWPAAPIGGCAEHCTDVEGPECQQCCQNFNHAVDWKCGTSEAAKCCNEWGAECFWVRSEDNFNHGCKDCESEDPGVSTLPQALVCTDIVSRRICHDKNGCDYHYGTSTHWQGAGGCMSIEAAPTCGENIWHKQCKHAGCVWASNNDECLDPSAGCPRFNGNENKCLRKLVCEFANGLCYPEGSAIPQSAGEQAAATGVNPCAGLSEGNCKALKPDCAWDHAASPRDCKKREDMPCTTYTKKSSCLKFNADYSLGCVWDGSSCS